jgi:hypothetical protein
MSGLLRSPPPRGFSKERIENGDMKAPNAKHQTSNKSQSPKLETRLFWSFEIGIWSLFVIWDFRHDALQKGRYE